MAEAIPITELGDRLRAMVAEKSTTTAIDGSPLKEIMLDLGVPIDESEAFIKSETEIGIQHLLEHGNVNMAMGGLAAAMFAAGVLWEAGRHG